MKFLKYIQGAFDTHSKSASARKLSAFWVIILITLTHICWFLYARQHENFSLLSEILFIDFAFVSAALGMTTYETITKIKHQKKDENNTDPSSDSHVN